MLIRDLPKDEWLAISQPAHALVSGQMMRAWGAPGFARPEPFEDLVTAAAQHDVAWMGWETAPTLDPETGRPHLFRKVGAAVHAPMWAEGVSRALAAWGPWVALLVSRHGSLIYGRYTDRHQLSTTDAEAVAWYERTQGALQADLARKLGATAQQLEQASALIAAVDALSLAVCGDISTNGGVGIAPMTDGSMARLTMATRPDGTLTLDPWPFTVAELVCSYPARRFGAAARWQDEGAMRAALDAAGWETGSARLVPAT